MNIKQLFPSWKCDGQQFHTLFPAGTVLTVRSVEARKTNDEEEYLCLYFDELKKPISLNKTNAFAIADIAQTDETDEWPGILIKMLAVPVEYTDSVTKTKKMTMGFRVYPARQSDKPTLQPNSDLTRMLVEKQRRQLRAGSATGAASTPGIGFETAVGMMAYIEERGKTFDDVVAMAKTRQFDHHLTGDIPPNLKEDAKKVVAAICKDFPKIKDVNKETLAAKLRALWYPPAPVGGEVIDRVSGEVLAPAPDEFNPDDIPF